MVEENERQFFACKDKLVVSRLLENVNEALKDTDASEEKKLVKDFLRKVSTGFRFVAVGSAGVGKSGLLNELFGKVLYKENEAIPHTIGFREYRYGGEDAEILIEPGNVRIFRNVSELEGICVIDTQGTDEMEAAGQADKMKQQIQQSDVLIVVLSAENIRDFAVWDLLEGTDAGKVLFVLTKCDLVDETQIQVCKEKIAQYMEEIHLHAPVFTVSSVWEGTSQIQKTDGFESVRNYIKQNILGTNPILTKQRENVVELKQLLKQLSSSFELRKKQHDADKQILERINSSMDSFFANNRFLIDSLEQELTREIESELDAYQNEIIAKLDPHQIKERFANGSREFTDYLNFIHEGYRQRMTTNVNQQTQAAIRKYLSGLEQVFEEATGYFRKRERLIALEDKFYGSLAESKQYMSTRAEESIKVTQDYYHALTDASSELFMKIWNARSEYDKKMKGAQIAGGVAGAILGGGTAIGVGTVAAAGAAAAAGTAATAGTSVAAAVGAGVAAAGLWPVIGALVGGLLIAKIAKNIASAKSMPELEKSVQKSIEEFKMEVSKNRTAMTEEILNTIEAIFKRELDTADKTFLDFRMSVNIDSQKIPLLEERMEKIDGYLLQIEEMEREVIM